MNTFLLILCTDLLGYGLYSCHFELEVNNEYWPLLELPAFVVEPHPSLHTWPDKADELGTPKAWVPDLGQVTLFSDSPCP